MQTERISVSHVIHLSQNPIHLVLTVFNQILTSTVLNQSLLILSVSSGLVNNNDNHNDNNSFLNFTWLYL